MKNLIIVSVAIFLISLFDLDSTDKESDSTITRIGKLVVIIARGVLALLFAFVCCCAIPIYVLSSILDENLAIVIGSIVGIVIMFNLD